MRAIVHDTYGSPDVMELRELQTPELTDDVVLVRVRASSVNPADWYALTGRPQLARIMSGLRKPKSNALGTDFAGTVEAVGREDFTRSDRRYDLVLDVAGSRSWSELKRVLEPKATVVIVGAPKGKPLLGPLVRILKLRLLALAGSRKARFFIAKLNRPDLDYLRELIEAGQVQPVVDRRYELSDAADAFRYLGEGHARGKVVVTL